jgi:hypothetical protein
MEKKLPLLLILLVISFTAAACQTHSDPSRNYHIKVLVNQVGYDSASVKCAVIEAQKKLNITSFKLLNAKNGSEVYHGKVEYKGTVDHWKNWKLWTLNFTKFQKPGKYFLKVNTKNGFVRSYVFRIGKTILDRYTLSNVIYYFKSQRSSGLFNKADSHLRVPGTNKTVDVRGGWYDATGDYGIHFTQLSQTSYFNTQQVPLVEWSLLKSYEELKSRDNLEFSQYERRLIGGGMFGADFLYRMHIPGSSFYTSIDAPGAKKLAKNRHLAVIIPPSVYKSLKGVKHPAENLSKRVKTKLKPQIASFRAGGGMSIAALALAADLGISGEYSPKDYLSAAENAFNFLQKNDKKVTNNGKENIVDDYCALLAATELYKASHKQTYKKAAAKRADSLMNRLTTWKKYKNYWRANNKKRPFFSPSDAGLPVVSLWEYYEIADAATKKKILQTIKKSMKFELTITSQVNNPFGYARQLVQDTTGKRYSAFFFPHNTKTAPWWQGENARLASLATAARITALHFKQSDPKFSRQLENYAWNQLNWILGLNPFNVCMLDGSGHNNPQYDFQGTWQYTAAPGGIVNGITSAYHKNSGDIDFEIPYSVTGKDDQWRWEEQWLPHAAWYMLAVSVKHK